ncbi:MAG: hypothetical protein ABEH56_05930 [Salinirussus sp.]
MGVGLGDALTPTDPEPTPDGTVDTATPTATAVPGGSDSGADRPSATPSTSAPEGPTEDAANGSMSTPESDRNPLRRELRTVLNGSAVDADTRATILDRARRDGRIDRGDVTTAKLLLNSSRAYAEAALSARPDDGDWRHDGDSLLYGVEVRLLNTSTDTVNKNVTLIRDQLAADGNVSARDVQFLRTVVNGTHDRDAAYSRWSQLRELGLAERIVADGTVNDTEMAAVARSDEDVLIDAYERHLGTDPQASDTDGDGLRDGWEVYRTDLYPNADPTKLDIYVEIDRMEGVPPFPETAKNRIVEMFEEAPEMKGKVNLHLRFDEIVPATRPVHFENQPRELDDLYDYRSKYFDHAKQGYHYALLATDRPFLDGDDVMGAADDEGGEFVVSGTSDPAYLGPSFAHELVHSVGVHADEYAGIDSREIPLSEYRSTMNYNSFTTDPKSGIYELAPRDSRNILADPHIPATGNVSFPASTNGTAS